MDRDGSFVCLQCRCKLNETDKNCWRCGSKKLQSAPQPATPEEVAIFSDSDPAMEEILRALKGDDDVKS